MSFLRHSWLSLVLFVLVTVFHSSAQTDQLLPEIDAYYKLNSDLRIWFQAKETREGGDPTSAEIGPSLDFYLKPWIKLKDATPFSVDDSKRRPIIFSVGYRYLPTPDAPSTNRFEPIITFNVPVTAKTLLWDRNRADLDWESGN